MKLAFLITCIFASTVTAFSELIPTGNYSPSYNEFLVDCGQMNFLEIGQAQLENIEAFEKARQAKENLFYASVWQKMQKTLGISSPAIYLLMGYQCSEKANEALKNALAAAKIISLEIDQEIEKLDFEIGDGVPVPGATELSVAKETKEGKGELGEIVKKMQIDTTASEIQMKNRNPGKAVETASWIIMQNGAIDKLEKYLKQLKKRQSELTTITEDLNAQVEENTENTKNLISELKENEVNNLGWFELNQLELETRETLIVEEVVATSPAGLLMESQSNLKQAQNALSSSRFFKNRARTANKITTLINAVGKVQKAKRAGEKSLEKTLDVLKQMERKTQNEIELASAIEKPFARKVAQAAIEKSKLSGNYFQRIMSLDALVKTLAKLRMANSGEVSEKEKLKLKMEIRELQRIASAAEKKGISSASETLNSLKEIYSLVDTTSNGAEFIELENQKDENQEILFELIEGKLKKTRELYAEAEALEGEGSFTPQEEKRIAELRDVFAGNGQLARRIGEIDEIENSLKTLLENAMKRRNSQLGLQNNPASFALETKIETNNSKQENVKQNQPLAPVDGRAVLREFEEINAAGLNAFYSGEKTKKSIEQIKFENILKNAQKKAKEIEKTPSQENVNEMKKYVEEMNNAIEEVQRKAGVEIAIAEQRSVGSEPALKEAQEKWQTGRYIEALQTAQKYNKENRNSETPSKVTGQVASNDDPKLWAIGISSVVILIGAAYLLYVKKNELPLS